MTTGCWKQPSHFNWKNAPGAEHYENLMWQAVREKDWREVQQHLSPAFVGVTADGRKFDHLAWIEHWKAVEIHDLTLGEMIVQPSGPDMVVSYELKISGSESGRPLPPASLRVVSVWQELKKGWILTTQTSTPIM